MTSRALLLVSELITVSLNFGLILTSYVSAPSLAKALRFERSQVAATCPGAEWRRKTDDPMLHCPNLSLMHNQPLPQPGDSRAGFVQPGSCHDVSPDPERQALTQTSSLGLA